MKFYAFRPDKQGEEPFGTNDRILFSCPNKQKAIQRTESLFGDSRYVLYSYINFHDESTFNLIKLVK